MTIHGTSPANTNDSWAAYTHVTAHNIHFEIRHPLKPDGFFTIWLWNDLCGYRKHDYATTLHEALDRLKGFHDEFNRLKT